MVNLERSSPESLGKALGVTLGAWDMHRLKQSRMREDTAAGLRPSTTQTGDVLELGSWPGDQTSPSPSAWLPPR